MRRAELSGQRFGKLTVVAAAGSRHGNALWECGCDCGSRCVVAACHLKSGHTKSCGCSYGTHGASYTPEYRAWVGMVQRCEDPASVRYHRYGGRGIKVCAEWRNDFTKFLEHVGPRPSPSHSLDRVCNDKGYQPGNVRWATSAEQVRNTSRNVQITFNGETMVLTDWAQRIGLHPTALAGRIRRGMPLHLALTLPVGLDNQRCWRVSAQQTTEVQQ